MSSHHRLARPRAWLVAALALLLATPRLDAAILNICGFETGNDREASTTSGTFSIQSTTKHTGTYALRVNPATTAVGWVQLDGYSSSWGNGTSLGAATVYFHCKYFFTTFPAANTEPIASWRTGSALKAELRVSSGGLLSFYDQTATIVGSPGATALSTSTWYSISGSIGTGSSGAFDVRINGTTELSGTADTTTTNHNNMRVGKTDNRNGQTVDFYVDDCTLDDATLPATTLVIKALNPTGDGNYTAWTVGAGAGADWENVDDTPPDDDTTYLLSTGTAGDASTVALENASAETITGTIRAVKPHITIKRDTGSNGSVQGRLRSNTTDTDGTDAAAAATWQPKARIFTTDPATSAAWTTSGLDGVEVGVEERVTGAATTRLTYAALMVAFEPGAGGGPAGCANGFFFGGLGCNE